MTFDEELAQRVHAMRRLGVTEIEVGVGHVRRIVLGPAPELPTDAPELEPTQVVEPEPSLPSQAAQDAARAAKKDRRLFGAGR